MFSVGVLACCSGRGQLGGTPASVHFLLEWCRFGLGSPGKKWLFVGEKYAGSPVRIPYQNMKLFSGALNFFNTGRLNLFTRRPVTGEKKTVDAFSHMLALRSVKRFVSII